ncbi:DUF6660 family protein [Flagellimonas sp. 2504JD1-5]
MKWTLIILSVYFLSLNLLPCGDSDSSSEITKIEVNCADNGHDHDSSHLCSPFCQCQCCHIPVFPIDHESISSIHITYSSEVYGNEAGFIQEVSHSLFQPPRFFG